MDHNILKLISSFPWYSIENDVGDISFCDLSIIYREGNARVVPFELKSEIYPGVRVFDCFNANEKLQLNYGYYNDDTCVSSTCSVKYGELSDKKILEDNLSTMKAILDVIALHGYVIVSDKISKKDFLKMKIKNG